MDPSCVEAAERSARAATRSARLPFSIRSRLQAEPEWLSTFELRSLAHAGDPDRHEFPVHDSRVRTGARAAAPASFGEATAKSRQKKYRRARRGIALASAR
jgi:hypothetical protein